MNPRSRPFQRLRVAVGTWLGYRREQRRYREFFHRLGADSDNEWIRKSATVGGWLFPGEHEFLWRVAMESPPGDVIEVGTWMGKSACILAGTCLTRGDGSVVYCVDPFDLRGTEWQMAFSRRLIGGRPSTFDAFVRNAQRLGFYEAVITVAAPSEAFLGRVRAPLRLAFLDGSHEYDQVALETSLVGPWLVEGGCLAFHDATPDFPGVERFVAGLEASAEWEALPRTGSIAAFRKRAGPVRA